MRLKSFTAPDIQTAMDLIRQELGDEAIVVSSRQGDHGEGIRVVAAVEQADEGVLSALRSEGNREKPFANAESFATYLRGVLRRQGIPNRLAGRILVAAMRLGYEGAVMALATALDEIFRFSPVELPVRKPLVLVGPSGSGKTTVAIKLAVRAHEQRRRFKVISTDTVRAGAIEQIACFTRILKTELAVAGESGSLVRAVESAKDHDLVVIDTPGTNPRHEAEMVSLASTVKAIDAEPLLVMAAGGDAGETAEAAMAFSALSPRRLIVTRLDMVRRLGGILSAAEAGRLRYANVSVSGSVTSDISPLNPVSLARMLIGSHMEEAQDQPVSHNHAAPAGSLRG